MTELPMGMERIRAALPHRYPMLLVDRVTQLVPNESIIGHKAISGNEPWYRELPDQAAAQGYAYPSMLLIESWCQTAGILATWEQPNPDVLAGQVMLFGGMAGIRFERPVFPGVVVDHHVRLVRALTDTMIFEGEAVVAGEPVMSVQRVVMAMRPATELRPPADADRVPVETGARS